MTGLRADASGDLVVTSPPYFAPRAYGTPAASSGLLKGRRPGTPGSHGAGQGFRLAVRPTGLQIARLWTAPNDSKRRGSQPAGRRHGGAKVTVIST